MRIVVILLVSLAGAARADVPPPEFYREVAAGFRAYDAGDYAAAIAAFTTANERTADPRLLYAIANAQRKAGDCAAAIRSYRAFLDTGSTATLDGGATTWSLRDLSAQNIAACDAELAHRTVVERDLALAETRDRLAASDVERRSLEHRLLDAESIAIPQRVALPWYRDRVGHLLTASGLACLGTGATLWWIGRDRVAAVDAATDRAQYLDRLGRAGTAIRDQQIGIGLGIAGGALVLGGVLRYVSRDEITIMVHPLHGGGIVGAAGAL